MIEKIKEKIDQNKKDKKSFNDYIKSFCDSNKAHELFDNNEDFKKLCSLNKKEEKEEF